MELSNPRGMQKLAKHKTCLGDVPKLWLFKIDMVSP